MRYNEQVLEPNKEEKPQAEKPKAEKPAAGSYTSKDLENSKSVEWLR